MERYEGCQSEVSEVYGATPTEKEVCSHMENKTITLPPTKKETQVREVKEKTKKTRVLVENLVLIQESDYNPELQWNILFGGGGNICDKNHNEYLRTTIKRHISMKLHSYKTQDQKNEILDEEQFVDIDFVLDLLKKSNMQCFYCKELVQLLYKHVREPKQWTLDRINNDIGHNRGNVEIACLSCNLRRRCIYHERYVFTKQMKIVKTET